MTKIKIFAVDRGSTDENMFYAMALLEAAGIHLEFVKRRSDVLLKKGRMEETDHGFDSIMASEKDGTVMRGGYLPPEKSHLRTL